MIKKFKKSMEWICRILEMATAVLVLAGILLTFAGVLENFDSFRELTENTGTFRHYLEDIFVLVIGIEFLQMLCGPSSDHVIEILIFLMARHMIVGETTIFEDFVSVVSVAILFLLRNYAVRSFLPSGISQFRKKSSTNIKCIVHRRYAERMRWKKLWVRLLIFTINMKGKIHPAVIN